MAKGKAELAWARELVEKFASRVAHTFVLHSNVSDYVRTPEGQYVSLKKYLTNILLQGWQIVIFYDRASGIHFLDKEKMEKEFRKIVGSRSSQAEPRARAMQSDGYTQESKDNWPKEPEAALPILEQLLRTSPQEASRILGREIKSNFAAVIIGFAETIFPDGPITDKGPADRVNIITLAQWARRSKIEDSGNLILLMTNNLGQINSCLRTPDSNVETIRIPLPDFEQRLTFIKALPTILEDKKLELGTDADALASATSGLTRTSIKDLALRTIYLKCKFDVDFVWENKGSILEQASGGLIQIMRPENGFEVIGGLEQIKKHFQQIVAAIRSGDILMVPQGVLMVGPPGTGKSVLAEALAFELGFALVKIRNLRSMWQGMSEGNQELVFDLLDALSPVVVFEDEIDQQEQARGTIFHGDSGVTARMTAKKMEFMSDVARRGRILWIGACNRSDLMDSAMLRPGRFDDIIPCLPPNAEERLSIFRALFLKMERQARKYHKAVEFSVKDDELKELSEESDGYTGAEIELIIHRAICFAAERGSRSKAKESEKAGTRVEIADLRKAFKDFIPSRNQQDFELMIKMALRLVNSARMIPPQYLAKAREVSKN